MDFLLPRKCNFQNVWELLLIYTRSVYYILKQSELHKSLPGKILFDHKKSRLKPAFHI